MAHARSCFSCGRSVTAVVTSAEFAHREAARALTQQQAKLEAFRNRAVGIFAALTAAGGFLAAEALKSGGWEWIAAVGFAFYGGVAYGTVLIIWPQDFHFRFDPVTILDGWQNYSEEEHYEHLARFLSAQYDGNEAKLDAMAETLRAMIVATVLAIAAWFLLAVLN